MFGETLFSNVYFAVAGVAGFAVGALVSYLFGNLAGRSMGRRADDLHHRIRGLEADLRVAQRTTDQSRAERDALTGELAKSTAELVALRDKATGQDELLRKIRAEFQHECNKTARLRQELADRAEEMVRTHVQLRDVQNELGVTQVGSDVVMDRLSRLERERDDLNAMVASLRNEIAGKQRGSLKFGSSPSLDQGSDLLVDC